MVSGASGEVHGGVMDLAYRELGARKGAGGAVKQVEKLSSPSFEGAAAGIGLNRDA